MDVLSIATLIAISQIMLLPLGSDPDSTSVSSETQMIIS